MAKPGDASTTDAVRVLAAPGSVLALALLIINDHVLKEAWPGLVTGKLSDVAGLVVAPLLLAVPLSLIRVRRALPVAIALTGIGFVLAKTSTAGAAVTSDLWSLTGVPTLIRADPTDLVALPALAFAWWVDRRVTRAPALPWRRVAMLAAGMAVLPVAVFGTAATGCFRGSGLTEVTRVEGDFPGRPRQVEQRLSIGNRDGLDYTIDATRRVEQPQVELSTPGVDAREQCDPASPDSCWRIFTDGVGVEHSTDGGVSWVTELELTEDQLDALLQEIGDDCGDEPTVQAFDIGVLPTGGEPVVVLPVGLGGVYIREEDLRWTRYASADLYDLAADNTTPTPLPQVTPLDQPAVDEPSEGEGTGGGGQVTPTCANPSPTTVTPNPLNGPPTTYAVCR